MDIHDYINDIMFHILNDESLIEKILNNITNTNLTLEVHLDKKIPANDSNFYNVNLYKKAQKQFFLKNILPKYKKIKKEDTNEQCTICLEDYMENTYKRTLECNHHFHKKCIDKWLKKCEDENIHCPICRNQFNIPLEFITKFCIQKNI